MSASALGARVRGAKSRSPGGGSSSTGLPRMVAAQPKPHLPAGAQGACVDLGGAARVALLLTPQSRGPFRAQAQEVLEGLLRWLEQQSQPMAVTVQTIFLREAADQIECERLLYAFYGAKLPVTTFVLQPPCCGAALALEAWAIGGQSVRVEPFGPHTLAVSYDGVRWVYCAGITPAAASPGVYAQTTDTLGRLRAALVEAGSGLEHVVRTWFYLGGITAPEGALQRYQELNRARSDFYQNVEFCGALMARPGTHRVYPASTGIGMAGTGLVASCLALETRRPDLRLLPLENPQQTPAYVYHASYSPESPKFSRAMALLLGDYATTWISGTASIVESESRFPGDIEKQTEQTLDNIERLIAPENFARHGVSGAGAGLHDIAKVRVYLKRPQDFERCRAVCERRFGSVPALYAVADVCRPELLVEIEGVAFSRCAPVKSAS